MFNNCCAVFTRAPAGRVSPSPGEDATSVVPALPIEMLRSKSESRILQPSFGPVITKEDTRGSPVSCSARSLFEASALRVALHERTPATARQPDKDDKGVPLAFLRAYLAALKEGNIRHVLQSIFYIVGLAAGSLSSSTAAHWLTYHSPLLQMDLRAERSTNVRRKRQTHNTGQTNNNRQNRRASAVGKG
jgi:hypothetical protein